MPVVAADVAYIAPGVYRELLTLDVSGGAGTEITYIADVTGENTDGVGGIVRISASDNDQTAARAYCISGTNIDYRTFRGFYYDSASTANVFNAGGTDWIIEDFASEGSGGIHINMTSAEQADCTIRRFILLGGDSQGISFSHGVQVDDTGHLVENGIVLAVTSDGIRMTEVFGVTMRNLLVMGCDDGIDATAAGVGGETANVVENCQFLYNAGNGLEAAQVGDIVEDYNNLFGNGSARQNVNAGGNSTAYVPLLNPPILFSGASQVSGFKFPWWFGELSEWSALQAITGSNEPTEDMQGIERPTTASKNSWGPLQFMDAERETGTTRGASVASLALHDAGRHQIWVPVENSSTTISVYVYREANYAGGNPQMLVKQPGQADDVTTDAAAASQWNLLTTTLTPAADPPYVVVELVSENTAVALAYEVFFDDLVVA